MPTPGALVRRTSAGDVDRQLDPRLFAEQPVGSNIWVALAWCVGILIFAYVFAMVISRRKTS